MKNKYYLMCDEQDVLPKESIECTKEIDALIEKTASELLKIYRKKKYEGIGLGDTQTDEAVVEAFSDRLYDRVHWGRK